MKKFFEEPKVKVFNINAADIIAASTVNTPIDPNEEVDDFA